MSAVTDRLSDEDLEAIARVIFTVRQRIARERAERDRLAAEQANKPTKRKAAQ